MGRYSLTTEQLLAAGYRADPETGVVYGKRGQPIRRLAGGYVQIGSGGRSYMQGHRFVWECVHGPIPEGMQINHINGIRNDNRICNLEVVTPSENLLHAYRIGLANAEGENNGRAILTEAQVSEIRASRKPQRVLAKHFGVSRRTVRDILSRRNWSQIA